MKNDTLNESNPESISSWYKVPENVCFAAFMLGSWFRGSYASNFLRQLRLSKPLLNC